MKERKIDLYCTAGASPPDNGAHKPSPKPRGIRIGSVRFVQTGDLQSRLRRMALLLLGSKASARACSRKSKGGFRNAA